MAGDSPVDQIETAMENMNVAAEEGATPTAGLSAAQKKRLKKKQNAAKKEEEKKNPSNKEEEELICADGVAASVVLSPEEARKMLIAKKTGKQQAKNAKKKDDAAWKALQERGGVMRKGGQTQKAGSGFFDPPNWDMGEMGGRQENPD